MRLSDAIALGQHLIKWDDEVTLLDGRGCACGMALAALGQERGSPRLFYERFPWAAKHDLWTEITNRFFKVHAGEVSLDELIDWVRSVEPAETESEVTETQAVEVAQ